MISHHYVTRHLLETCRSAKVKTIDEVLDGIGQLRLFPPAAQKVLRLANNPAANLKSIEMAVKLDPVLTARVLKIANSAFYGAPQRIATLGQALGVMGFEPAPGIGCGSRARFITSRDTLKDRNLGNIPYKQQRHLGYSVDTFEE